ncbi:MAG: NAD(P)-dependent oxidoreductase [Bacteroidota bacterium]|nr:NAD(P)-dependent oxidoreductase [Bacteroidota bacterium]
MKRILVTGASGLVGKAFLRALPPDIQPIALARREVDGIETIKHDLRSPNLPTLPDDVDTVVHLAQEPHFRDFPRMAPSTHAVNTEATLHLLDWARLAGAKRFILASTGGLYAITNKPITEEQAIEIGEGPLAFYFATKRGAELLTERYQTLMTTIILRFFFVYGAGQSDTMLFPRLIASVQKGQPIQLAGQDGLRFNPIHAKDAGDAVAAALKINKHLTANIAGPEIVTMRALGEKIGRQLAMPVNFTSQESLIAPSMVADISIMREKLVVPKIGITEGISEAAGPIASA